MDSAMSGGKMDPVRANEEIAREFARSLGVEVGADAVANAAAIMAEVQLRVRQWWGDKASLVLFELPDGSTALGVQAEPTTEGERPHILWTASERMRLVLSGASEAPEIVRPRP
jgi:hypothetical protein